MISSAPPVSQAASRAKPGIGGDGAIRLNLGGRSTSLQGFLKVDLFDGPDVDVRTNAADLSMFGSGTVQEIYASHILEHFPHPKTVEVLKEWHRVLAPEGILWVSVPDFDACARLYKTYGMTDFVRNLMYGDQEYNLAYHYTIFTFGTLAFSCAKAGFSDVERVKTMPYGLRDCSTNVDTFTKQPISVSVKATA